MARYTFGDDDDAIERMALVASAYEPASAAFLAAHAPRRAGVALDLGCGPGLSTALVDRVCGPQVLIGVDSSPAHVDVARARVARARFVTHDVTTSPLPGAPADLVYARLVLAHLPDPLGTARRWAGDLGAGGSLLVEDLEGIEAPPGPLRDYDEISAAIVRAGGGLMFAGAALAPLGGRCVAVTVPAALAARIYLFNVGRWIADPTRPAPVDRLTALRHALGALAEGDGSATVSWIVRQVAVTA